MKKSLKKTIIISYILLPVITAAAVGIIAITNLTEMSGQSKENYETAMYENYDNNIKQQTQSVLSLISYYYGLQESGVLTEEEAQQEAAEAVRSVRYGTDDSGYFWIDRSDGVLVMHPILPEQEGNNREDMTDQNGNLIIQMIRESCLSRDGAGYNNFWFTKSDGVTVGEKRAYSAYFYPWEWCISTGNYMDEMQAQIDEKALNVETRLYEMIRMILGASLILVAVSAVAAVAVSRKIVGPLTLIRQMAGRIAEGDFSTDVEVKQKNEFGETLTHLNNGQKNVRILLEEMKNVSDGIFHLMKDLTEGFERIGVSARNVSDAMEDMTESITSQAESTEQTNEKMGNMGEKIEETGHKVMNLNEKSQAMKELSNQAMDTMQELSRINTETQDSVSIITKQTQMTNESADKIADAAKLIDAIARQTSLLSLNASIEAARAGEMGKGFAVVAEEIGTLSRQSADAVKTIDEIISDLTSNSHKAVDIIESVGKIMEMQDGELNKTKEMFEGLYHNVEESIQVIGDLTDMTCQMEQEKESVSGLVENLSAAAQENAANTEQTNQVSAGLMDIMEELAGKVEDLNLSVKNLNLHVAKFAV